MARKRLPTALPKVGIHLLHSVGSLSAQQQFYVNHQQIKQQKEFIQSSSSGVFTSEFTDEFEKG